MGGATAKSMYNPHCRKCQYRNAQAAIYGVCNYLSISQDYFPEREKHSRGCSVADCTHWQDPPIFQLKHAGQLNAENLNERNRRIYEMYKDGLTDEEIGKAVGLSQHTIADWRKRNHLPLVDRQRKPRFTLDGFTEEEIAERRRMSNRKAYAKRHGISFEELSENREKRIQKREEQDALFREKYAEGKFDPQIATECGCDRRVVTRWRKRNGLESNYRKVVANGQEK